LFVSLSFCFLLTCCFLLKCRWLWNWNKVTEWKRCLEHGQLTLQFRPENNCAIQKVENIRKLRQNITDLKLTAWNCMWGLAFSHSWNETNSKSTKFFFFSFCLCFFFHFVQYYKKE
jgi:hypothetical protein